MNKIINNVPEIKSKKRIVFIYAVKEDIFDGEKKSKFFDILIPIKPILSVNNAVHRLYSILGVSKNKFDDDYLRLIALDFKYVRQMNNVVNAFNIITYGENYNHNMNSYVFTALLYKHLFPLDYILHLRGDGIITYLLKECNKMSETDINGISWGKIQEKNAYFANKKEDKNFTEIKKFYSRLRKYLNETSFDMISNIPTSEISNNDKYFISNILSDNDIDNSSYHIEDFEVVLKEINDVKYVKRNSFYNYELLKYILEGNKYQNLYNEFIKEFKVVSERKNAFLKGVLEKEISKESGYFKFIKDVSNTYPLLNIFSLEENSSSEDVLTYMVEKKLITKSNFSILNNNRAIECILNVSSYPIEIIFKMDTDILSLINDAHTTLKIKKMYVTNIEEKYYKVLDFIIDNLLFDGSQENHEFIYRYKKIFSNESGVFDIIPNFCPKLYDYFKNLTFYLSDNKMYSFKNDNPQKLLKVLSDFSIDSAFLNVIFETCPLMEYNENILITDNVLKAFSVHLS